MSRPRYFKVAHFYRNIEPPTLTGDEFHGRYVRRAPVNQTSLF